MHKHLHSSASRKTFLTLAGAASAAQLFPFARASAQGSRGGLIDIHHHYYSPELFAVMNAWQVKHNQPPLGGPLASWTPEVSLAEMDRNGIATALLSLWSHQGIWFDVSPSAIPALARSCNEYVAKVMRDHPGRFGLLAALPMPDVAASLAEIRYVFDTLHADGIGIPTNWHDRWPGHPDFEPVWAELNRRKAVVVFHPCAPGCCAMLQSGIAESYLEYPYDSGRVFLSLLFGGMLAKYRDVRWTLCHGGGTLPFLAGRLTILTTNSREKLDVVAPNGLEAELKRMYFDTANATSAPTMAAIMKEMPPTQLLFGTDYPYVSAAQNIGPLVQDGLNSDDLAAIQRGNALRLFPRLRASA